jgi:hypothetical protein
MAGAVRPRAETRPCRQQRCRAAHHGVQAHEQLRWELLVYIPWYAESCCAQRLAHYRGRKELILAPSAQVSFGIMGQWTEAGEIRVPLVLPRTTVALACFEGDVMPIIACGPVRLVRLPKEALLDLLYVDCAWQVVMTERQGPVQASSSQESTQESGADTVVEDGPDEEGPKLWVDLEAEYVKGGARLMPL